MFIELKQKTTKSEVNDYVIHCKLFNPGCDIKQVNSNNIVCFAAFLGDKTFKVRKTPYQLIFN